MRMSTVRIRPVAPVQSTGYVVAVFGTLKDVAVTSSKGSQSIKEIDRLLFMLLTEMSIPHGHCQALVALYLL